jgi:hypothetical protein
MRIVLILLVFVISSLVIAKQSITDEKVFVCSGYDTIETFSESGKQEGPVVSKGTILELSLERTNDSIKNLFDEPEYDVYIRSDFYFPSEEVKRDGDNTLSAIYANSYMPVKFRYDMNLNILHAYHETSNCQSQLSISHLPFNPATCVKIKVTTFEGICSEQSRIVK